MKYVFEGNCAQNNQTLKLNKPNIQFKCSIVMPQFLTLQPKFSDGKITKGSQFWILKPAFILQLAFEGLSEGICEQIS